jgi:hypothetical protein
VTWGSDVGLGKNLFLVGLADDEAEMAADLASQPCGAGDWLVVAKEDCVTADLDSLLNRLAIKEKQVDPTLYPRLRGRKGLFKVKLEHVENHILVKKALDGFEPRALKLKPLDYASYLIHNALK